jgi:hypothetical protein
VTIAILIAGVAAAAFAAWGVYLQIDARRPLLTATFGPGFASGSDTERRIVDYALTVRNDGTAPVRGVTVEMLLDGEATEMTGTTEPVNLAPDAQVGFVARVGIPLDSRPDDALSGRTLTARITYNQKRTATVMYPSRTTLR